MKQRLFKKSAGKLHEFYCKVRLELHYDLMANEFEWMRLWRNILTISASVFGSR